MLVNQLTDGQDVDLVLLVRDREVRTRRAGGEYLKLALADRTGSVSAVIREGVAEAAEAYQAGCAVRVAGRYDVHPRYGAQIAVRELRAGVLDARVWPELPVITLAPLAGTDSKLDAVRGL